MLRPEPGATATCAAAIAAGLDPIAITLFKIEPVAWEAPDIAKYDGLLLTSVNAIRHGGPRLDKLCGLPVYAVGASTAMAATQAGLAVSFTGDGGVDDLLGVVDPGLRLLHLCGEHRREPLAPAQSITTLFAYRAEAIASPDLAEAAGAVVAVHSQRAGARFAELASKAALDKSAVAIVAISTEVARATGAGWEQTLVAGAPNDTALLALAAPLCKNSSQR